MICGALGPMQSLLPLPSWIIIVNWLVSIVINPWVCGDYPLCKNQQCQMTQKSYSSFATIKISAALLPFVPFQSFLFTLSSFYVIPIRLGFNEIYIIGLLVSAWWVLSVLFIAVFKPPLLCHQSSSFMTCLFIRDVNGRICWCYPADSRFRKRLHLLSTFACMLSYLVGYAVPAAHSPNLVIAIPRTMVFQGQWFW